MFSRSISRPIYRNASVSARVELSLSSKCTTVLTNRKLPSEYSTSFSTTPGRSANHRRKLPAWRRSGLLEVQSMQSQQAQQSQHPQQSQKNKSTSANEALRQTPLHDLHIEHGGKMVPFGGYSMPVHYSDLSHVESHLWTRDKASLFDVSHMVQHSLKGPGAQGLLQKLTPAGLAELPNHHSTLSCFLYPENGGIVDDSVITRMGPESFYFVTNAACRDKDLAFLTESIEQWKKDGNENVQWDVMDGQGLVALQGPLAQEVLEPLIADMAEDKLDDIFFGQSKFIKLRLQTGKESSPVLVSRGGYTGEDGFEISIPGGETREIVDFLLKTAGPEKLRLAGLGARDSLRLEAGMCLYGHDLDETTTPVEGALSWIISKNRRTEGGFNGSEVILQQLKPKKDGGIGPERRRVGLIVEGAPAREGAEIYDLDDEHIGTVTSGSPSPTLKKNIAMGYVKTGHHKSGEQVVVVVRSKKRKAFVSKMPFVPSKYHKKQE